MNDIKRFEDLDVWIVARKLCNLIYSITRNKPMSNDYAFIEQIRRASVSIMNNIAEGFERGSNKGLSEWAW